MLFPPIISMAGKPQKVNSLQKLYLYHLIAQH